jgi:hypothetical protein
LKFPEIPQVDCARAGWCGNESLDWISQPNSFRLQVNVIRAENVGSPVAARGCTVVFTHFGLRPFGVLRICHLPLREEMRLWQVNIAARILELKERVACQERNALGTIPKSTTQPSIDRVCESRKLRASNSISRRNRRRDGIGQAH